MEWNSVKLEDLCDRITVGHVGSMASRYVSSGIPFLRSKNIKKGYLDLSDVKYIDGEFHDELRKSQIFPGDLVIVRTGDPGATAIIPEDLGPANCSDVIIATPRAGIDKSFLCYAINQTAQHFVQAHTVGAVQQHFNVGSAKKMSLAVPDLVEQEAVVAIIGSLDDKIAVNDRIVGTADDLSALVLEYRIRGNSDQFESVPLSRTAQFVNGRAFTKDATGTGRMVVRIAELKNGPGSSTVYNDIDVLEKHLARPGDVLFSWSGSLAVSRWFRPEAIVNQHIFKVVPNSGFPMWLVYRLVARKIEDFKAIAADKATTMGHIQRKHLDELVDAPSAEMLAELDSHIRPLWERALLAEQENLKLAELRDTLLPRLMSGELRVKDAERIVEDVT